MDRAQVDSQRKYVEAVGGPLRIEVELADADMERLSSASWFNPARKELN